ncbi:hypothetical protein GCM10011359_31440 [Nesterenkonia alkaliphila]|nr:hypothetical protein GCM10011359_31440 [Nesterenkonia alkaliphila]
MHILRGDHGKIYTYHEETRGHWRARFQYKPLLSHEVKCQWPVRSAHRWPPKQPISGH